MNPSYHTINKIEALIEGFRKRGLGGNIVSLNRENLSNGDEAAWTGERFELALVSTSGLPRLELRQLDNGLKTLVDAATDPRKYLRVMADFVSKEG